MQTATAEFVRDSELDDTSGEFPGFDTANDNEGKWSPGFRNEGDPSIKTPEPGEGDDGPEGEKDLSKYEITDENLDSEDLKNKLIDFIVGLRGGTKEEYTVKENVFENYSGKNSGQFSEDGSELISSLNNESTIKGIQEFFKDDLVTQAEKIAEHQAFNKQLWDNRNTFFVTGEFAIEIDEAKGQQIGITVCDSLGRTHEFEIVFMPLEEKIVEDDEGEMFSVPDTASEGASVEGGQASAEDILGQVEQVPFLQAESEAEAEASVTGTVENTVVSVPDLQVTLEKFFVDTYEPAAVAAPSDSIGDRLLRSALFFEQPGEVPNDSIDVRDTTATPEIIAPIQEVSFDRTAPEIVAKAVEEKSAEATNEAAISEVPEILDIADEVEETKAVVVESKPVADTATTAKSVEIKIAAPRAKDSIIEITKVESIIKADNGPDSDPTEEAEKPEDVAEVLDEEEKDELSLNIPVVKATIDPGIRLIKIDDAKQPTTKEISTPKQETKIAPQKIEAKDIERAETIVFQRPEISASAEVHPSKIISLETISSIGEEIVEDIELRKSGEVELAMDLQAADLSGQPEIRYALSGAEYERVPVSARSTSSASGFIATNDNQIKSSRNGVTLTFTTPDMRAPQRIAA